jgi:hypothetical protein
MARDDWFDFGRRSLRKRSIVGNPIVAARLSDLTPSTTTGRFAAMKTRTLLLAVAVLALAAGSAEAKGCLKGAVVGGVAGHYTGHHGVVGAIAGCAYGRHRANEQQRAQDRQQQTQAPAGQGKL